MPSVNNFLLKAAMKKSAFLRDAGRFFGKLPVERRAATCRTARV